MADFTPMFRAPLVDSDFLTTAQVDRYMGLLAAQDLKLVKAPEFSQAARAAPGGDVLEGAALGTAVEACLASMPHWQQVMRQEFEDSSVLPSVVQAFSKSSSVPRGELASFVSFCLAYRIHCYFETSHLPAGRGRPRVVFVLGGPGAGKGTQCARICASFGWQHLSAGDLLRAERQNPASEQGQLIENCIKEGKLVPAEVTVKLLKKAMEDGGWESGKYLVDGFPRSFDNLETWKSIVGSQANVDFCLFYSCSEACMESRLLERGKTSGRSDDNIESIKKRFATFNKESMPVVAKFKADGTLRQVRAEKAVEDVWSDTRALFGPQVVFVLGGPGAGKGTQCARISSVFGFQHLSAGDLLRAERKRPGSEVGALIESYIKEGNLVPVEITVKLIKQAMEEQGWEGGKYLIDGFPRSFENLEGWTKVMGDSVVVKFVLFFDCSEGCMELRLLERGKTSGRADDNPESIRKRFRTFQQESLPVVEKYREQGTLRAISAERPVEEVWQDVRSLFGPTVVFVLGGPGAGKGTQCTRIAETFGYVHLSAGDLLRDERKRPDSEYGELIESYIKEGKLVPVEIVVGLLKNAMLENGWEGGKYLIDGFPRSFENMAGWERTLGQSVCVKFALFFDCSEGVMEARLLERGKTSGRADDNIESIRKRFITFQHESLPLCEKLAAEGRLRKINGEQGKETVWTEVQALFGPSVVFVLGGPGAGKGTQCARIADSYGYKHLSAGDLLREERQRPGSEYGELIENHIKEGKIVPVEITVKLIKKAMENHRWEGGKYLVDGFPRNHENLQGWNAVMQGSVCVKFCIFFDCSEACMESRLLDRGKTSGRSDDNIESIKKRFLTFKQDSMPVAELLKAEGKLRNINAEQDKEAVWGDVQKLFGPKVVFVLGGPGSGKGTACARISHVFGFHHLSAGDLLRDERKRPGSEQGALIESYIKEGKLVPVEITIKLIKQAMEERGWEGGKYLIDGFPRSFDNLAGWDKVMGNTVDVKVSLFFDCSEPVMEARLLERGKTSGRADDNAESIKKRFRTFQEESMPVADKLEKDGSLRRIDAEQSVEGVWTCVQEVLHNELDVHLKNQAVVLLKPHAQNKDTERFVQSYLTSHNIAILKKGKLSVDQMKEKDVFGRQYFQLNQHASADPKTKKLTQASKDKFKEGLGVAWDEALAKGDLVSADQSLTTLGLSAEQLFDAWTASTQVKLAPSLYCARITAGGKSACVLNGFVPRWRETFAVGEGLSWFVVEFSTARLSWTAFRAAILGATDPKVAPEGSIRGQLYRHWAACGLKQEPTTMNNCVHASAGPIEGLRERMTFTGAELEGDCLGRLLLSSGVPRASITQWLDNPDVEGWKVGLDTRSGPVFDTSENCDHGVFRNSAVRHAQANGSLEGWKVTSRSVFDKGQPARATSRLGKPKVMTILHFNDVYNVEPREKEPVGGLARFVTKMRSLKAESVARGEEEAVCLFSGDAFNPSLTSTVTKGMHMVKALNLIGIHTSVYGNHDFDFGVDQLVKMKDQNNFPWLMSNVIDKSTGQPLAGGHVSRMLDFHGRKIGLIGLVEREWLVTLATIEPEDVEYEDFCPCGRRLAKELKERQGAEIVIALTHMRVPNDELLAHEVGEIDIILGGHDHHYEVKPVGPHGTYVLKSGTDFRDLTELKLEFTDQPGPKPFKIVGATHVEITKDIVEDPESKEFVDACLAKVGSAMDKVIGETAVDLDCRFASIRTKETNMGNFVADVMRMGLKADIAIINSGTLRADAIMEKGELKMRDLVNLLPMLDELCLLQLSGETIMAILQNACSQYPRLEGRFLQVSGVCYTFDAAKPGGERVLPDSVKVLGEPLDPARLYKVVTKDYLRAGKDGFDCLRGAHCLADGEQAGILPTLVRDFFLDVTHLNGFGSGAQQHDTKRAEKALNSGILQKVGDGPEPTKRYALAPQVDNRIVCLNP